MDWKDLTPRKVLNVQVPFYFKSIVDSLNVDFVAIGGTVWTVAGSVIIGCMSSYYQQVVSISDYLHKTGWHG